MEVPQLRNNFQEWHAVEHKLISLLTTGKELTMENLKEASMNVPHCTGRNAFLKEPSDEKLREALKVGQLYLKKN